MPTTKNRWFNSTKKVLFIYLFFSFLWIVVSDRLVALLVPDPELNLALQTYKGWLYVIVVGIFIYTEKTLAQKKISEGEIKYKEVIEQTNAAYFRMDSEGKIVFVNNAWLKMYKYDSIDDVMGKKYDVFQVKGQENKAKEIVDKLLSGQSVSGEFPRMNSDGSIGYFTYHANPVYGGNRIIGFEAFMFDTTDKKKYEKALAESESLFHSLFNSMVEGVAIHEVIFNKNGEPINYKILDVNDAFSINTTIKKDDAIGKMATDLYRTKKAPYLEEYYGTIRTGRPFSFDVYFEPLNKHFHISAFGLSKKSFVTVFQDITVRKEYEAEISRLASFPQLNPMPILEMDKNKKIIYKNPTYERWEKTVGKEKSKSFIPKDIDEIIVKLNQDSRKSIRREIEIDGSYFSEAITLTDPSNTIRIYAFDISRIKEAEKMLAEQKADIEVEKKKLEAIVEGMADAVFVVDNKLKLVMVNKAMEDLSGFTEKELIGHRYKDKLKFYYEESGKEVLDIPKTLFESGDRGLPSGNGYLVRKNGTRVAIDGVGSPIKNERGEVILAVGVIRDVTRQRELDRMRTEFVSLASHQLRTPLTGIKWFVELLQDHFDNIPKNQVKEYIEKVGESNERMIQLVNDLLNVSRIESGKMTREVTKQISIKKILSTVLNDHDKIIGDKKMKIIGLSKIKDYKIEGDETQLLQIFGNIIDNAIKYSEDGKHVWIDIREENSKKILISIKDEGAGIPADQQKRLFERFFRGDNVSKYIPGSGLGLYIVKNLLENHGGKIWLESKEGKGTNVYVELPFIINNNE
ncbi:MAG TPA: PAS domain S-box protein [Patescibacteria group bacterium]